MQPMGCLLTLSIDEHSINANIHIKCLLREVFDECILVSALNI